MNESAVNEIVRGGGLLVVAQWVAKEGQADAVADILRRFQPLAQNDPGVKMFLIARGKENPRNSCFTNSLPTRPPSRPTKRPSISRP